jgi:hypothetical protein
MYISINIYIYMYIYIHIYIYLSIPQVYNESADGCEATHRFDPAPRSCTPATVLEPHGILEGARPADTMQDVLFQPMLFHQVAMQTVDRSTPACSPIHGAIQRPICTSLQMLGEVCVGALLSTLSCSPSPSALAKPQSTVMLAKNENHPTSYDHRMKMHSII